MLVLGSSNRAVGVRLVLWHLKEKKDEAWGLSCDLILLFVVS